MTKLVAFFLMLVVTQFTLADSSLQNTGTGLSDCDRNIKATVLASGGFFHESSGFIIESLPKDTQITYDKNYNVKKTIVNARFFDGISRSGKVEMEVNLSHCYIKSLTFN